MTTFLVVDDSMMTRMMVQTNHIYALYVVKTLGPLNSISKRHFSASTHFSLTC